MAKYLCSCPNCGGVEFSNSKTKSLLVKEPWFVCDACGRDLTMSLMRGTSPEMRYALLTINSDGLITQVKQCPTKSAAQGFMLTGLIAALKKANIHFQGGYPEWSERVSLFDTYESIADWLRQRGNVPDISRYGADANSAYIFLPEKTMGCMSWEIIELTPSINFVLLEQHNGDTKAIGSYPHILLAQQEMVKCLAESVKGIQLSVYGLLTSISAGETLSEESNWSISHDSAIVFQPETRNWMIVQV